MKILISGFEAFGGLSVNPTEQLVKDIAEERMEGIEIKTILLPVIYHECVNKLIEVIEREQPDVVLSCGLAFGRAAVTPERIGINIQDTAGEGERGDNAGAMPVDIPILRGGPDGLFSTLPIRNITNALLEQGIPATISNSAGTYICNNTLYGILHYIKEHSLDIRSGFVHFPATPDMVADKPATPSMSYDTQFQALKIIVRAIAQTNQ